MLGIDNRNLEFDTFLTRRIRVQSPIDNVNAPDIFSDGVLFDPAIDSFEIGAEDITDGMSLFGWSSSLTLSATNYRVVAWTSGEIKLADGTTFSITAGNTGNMSALTFIYLDRDVSETALQVTTTSGNAVGLNKILVGVAQNNSDTASSATFQAFGGSGGVLMTVDSIAANSASTNEFITNTAQIADAIIVAAHIHDLNADKITAGTMTGRSVWSSDGNNKIGLTNGDLLQFFFGGVKQAQIRSDATGNLNIEAVDNLVFSPDGSKRYSMHGGYFAPVTNGDKELGKADKQWSKVHSKEYDVGSGWKISESGGVLYFKDGTTERVRFNGGKIRPADTYESSDGSDGTSFNAMGFITNIKLSGSAGKVKLYAKYRDFTVKDGIVTHRSSETGWIFLDSASGI